MHKSSVHTTKPPQSRYLRTSRGEVHHCCLLQINAYTYCQRQHLSPSILHLQCYHTHGPSSSPSNSNSNPKQLQLVIINTTSEPILVLPGYTPSYSDLQDFPDSWRIRWILLTSLVFFTILIVTFLFSIFQIQYL